jgi:predicted amidohydrolase YtcJ
MEGDQPEYAEALVVKDGKILFVGAKVEAMKQAGEGHQMIDLNGKTLLPGFIDGHSHITKYADGLKQADLSSPPLGKINNISDIITSMQDLKVKLKADDTSWLIGFNYDQDLLNEKRHPTAADLDAAFPTNPVILMHVSGHMLVANSVALQKVGINAATKDPAGGTIIRKKGTTEPEGLLQEVAQQIFIPFLFKPIPIEQELEKLKSAQQYYASNGVTTAAEHLAFPEKMTILDSAAARKELFIDIETLPAYTIADKIVGNKNFKWGTFNNHLKYTGIKMAVDGSPQGKTAFLTQPYLTEVPGCSHDCKGFPNLNQEQINQLLVLCYKNKVQVYSHCNGDASIDMMIKGHENAIAVTGDSTTDRRTVIIHSQIMRKDQLMAYKKYKLFPSYFTNHCYYWGDAHLENLGKERADFISPMKSTFDMGIVCTNHTDCAVTPMDQLFLLWTSVARETKSGKVLGESEKITPYQGLKALTINGAYEYFEENSKGSLKAGKLADLVIISKNPLKVGVNEIKNIKVVETIKEGKSVFAEKQ